MPAVHARFPAVRAVVALALIAALASLLALFAPYPARAAEHAVQIVDGAFSPTTLTISAGDTVTWRNADDRPHTVTASDGTFDSGNLDEGVGFSFTFTEPGTYTYVCLYHDDMQATIVVEADAADAPAAEAPAAEAPAAEAPSTGGAAPSGTDAPAGGGGTTAAASHEPGTHGAAQPDTALELPVSFAWLAPLLIGLGLVALAFGLVPPAPEPGAERATAGWRR